MTGIRPSDSGLTTNAGGKFFRDFQYKGKATLSNATTLPQWLRKRGWYTAYSVTGPGRDFLGKKFSLVLSIFHYHFSCALGEDKSTYQAPLFSTGVELYYGGFKVPFNGRRPPKENTD